MTLKYTDNLTAYRQGCLNNPSPTAFVSLNCPNSEVSNLQECGVMAVWDCLCDPDQTHVKVNCGKGNEPHIVSQ